MSAILVLIGMVGGVASALGYLRGMLNDDGRGLERATLCFIGFLVSLSLGVVGLILMMKGL